MRISSTKLVRKLYTVHALTVHLHGMEAAVMDSLIWKQYISIGE